jgi:HD-GYP domain-containing protein (c-di-GMP phosphodiesterase class II)
MGYLTKPVELPDLHESILKALHRREMLLQQREIDHVIREEVALRTGELEREKSALRDLTIQVAESLVIAMEAKNPYMRGRSIRIGELAASIADEMALDVDTVEAVRLAARLMDVGKIGIREEILNKPGALTPEEFAHVKQHVEMGLSILAPMKHLGTVLDYVRDHHEHFDGTGYPRQLSDNGISIGGRILAAADAYDALTSGRSYQEPLNPVKTLDYLGERVGTLLDPAVFIALSAVVKRRRSLTFITAIPN